MADLALNPGRLATETQDKGGFVKAEVYFSFLQMSWVSNATSARCVHLVVAGVLPQSPPPRHGMSHSGQRGGVKGDSGTVPAVTDRAPARSVSQSEVRGLGL